MTRRFNAPRLWSSVALTCALCFAAQVLLATATQTQMQTEHGATASFFSTGTAY